MSKRIKVSLIIFLTIAGFFFLFFNQISGYAYENWLEKNQEELLTSITKESIEDNSANLDDEFDYEAIENIGNDIVIPDINIADIKNAVGIITIPSVDLEEPILHGTTNQNLLLGATTMKPEQKMGEGNYTLAGHNHHSKNVLFQPIRNVEIGEEIHVTNKDKIYTYKVTDKEVVEPSRVDVLGDVEGKQLITLVSCYADDGSNRIIVTGELYEVTDFVKDAE